MTVDFEPSRAPWERREVVSLNAFQDARVMHPFTCRRRDEVTHRWNGNDFGVLVATEAGWTCLDCDYTQDWAHTFMVNDMWRLLTL